MNCLPRPRLRPARPSAAEVRREATPTCKDGACRARIRAGQEHPSHSRKTLKHFSVKASGGAEVRRITRLVVTGPGWLHGSKSPELYRRLGERRAWLGE